MKYHVILALSLVVTQVSATVGTGKRGIVAASQADATRAGINAMKAGGNAVDAAVAVGMTLSVTDSHNSGIGGGCFMLIRLANGKFHAIDGREMAPAKATRDMFLRDGKAVPDLSKTGALASGVPGALAAYAHASKEFGKLELADVVLPAAKLAREGFPIDAKYARRVPPVANKLRKFPQSAAIFLPDNKPPVKGQVLIQTHLAETIEQIARHGSDWFYKGPFAKRTEKWMKANGGLMTAGDFANYKLRFRRPVKGNYHGHEIVSFPPPSSGGVHVVQILNILEALGLNLASAQPAQREHYIAEAMKLAFADRAHWLGDPDYADVPLGLIDKSYAHGLASRIKRDQVIKVREHGNPPGALDRLFEKHTTHFCTADAEGNWVSCTATINTGFGSGVVIPGTGVIMNNEMDDFSAQPGAPNAFGLIGAEANAVEPGKRPLSSMSPTIVLKDGEPVLALGGAGGPTIITQTAQHILNVLDLGMSIDEAIAAPRIHHQWVPDQLRVEKRIDAKTLSGLKEFGHKIRNSSTIGVSQIISHSKEGFSGVADPRSSGIALGY
tara:strand:- start:71 stop:1735 length:1665 start_codon:yes stop_codon:yes gene_type:complete